MVGVYLLVQGVGGRVHGWGIRGVGSRSGRWGV